MRKDINKSKIIRKSLSCAVEYLRIAKNPINKLRDVYPEMDKYIKHTREICGGDEEFLTRYLDDPMFNNLASIQETATRALLTYYKLECEQVIVPNTNIPLNELFNQYINKLEAQIKSLVGRHHLSR